jgi:hypothetical protein
MVIYELEHECSAKDFHVNEIISLYLFPSDIGCTICIIWSFYNNATLLHYSIPSKAQRSLNHLPCYFSLIILSIVEATKSLHITESVAK